MSGHPTVAVHLFGAYRRLSPATRGRLEIALQPGDSVAVVLARVGLALDQGSLLAVNGEAVGSDRRLHSGDRLEVFSPMGGG